MSFSSSDSSLDTLSYVSSDTSPTTSTSSSEDCSSKEDLSGSKELVIQENTLDTTKPGWGNELVKLYRDTIPWIYFQSTEHNLLQYEIKELDNGHSRIRIVLKK
jgi:hypothetical protein